MAREFSYRVKTIGGETVTLTGKIHDNVQPEGNLQPALERARRETQRILIPPPMSATPTDAWTPPRPRDAQGERIQVTAHVSEQGHIVERWQITDEDIRWYRLETPDGKPLVPKAEQAEL
jgi:hypothetical protein